MKPTKLGLSPAGIAFAFGVSNAKVREAIHSGALPVHGWGRSSIVLVEDAVAFVRTLPPTKSPKKKDHDHGTE
jgi:hypothetical protein